MCRPGVFFCFATCKHHCSAHSTQCYHDSSQSAWVQSGSTWMQKCFSVTPWKQHCYCDWVTGRLIHDNIYSLLVFLLIPILFWIYVIAIFLIAIFTHPPWSCTSFDVKSVNKSMVPQQRSRLYCAISRWLNDNVPDLCHVIAALRSKPVHCW